MDSQTPGPNTNDSPSIHDNYLDYTDSFAAVYPDTEGVTNSVFSNNINMVTGIALPNSPSVTSSTFNISGTLSAGQVVGTTTATNNPTQWAITGPLIWSGSGCSSNCSSLSSTANYFSINNSGQVTLTSSGAASLPTGTTTITVEALNGGGFGSASIAVHYDYSVSYPGPGDIVSGATAFWGLRAYSSATAGSQAAVIRRASDNATTTIDTLFSGGFDTSTASTFCTSTSCYIQELLDQTGNGNNFVQTTSSKQPQLIFNGLGSLPVMSFSTSTYLCISSPPAVGQPWTASVVAERTASGYQSGLLTTRDSSGLDVGFLYRSATDTIGFGAGAADIVLSSLSDNSWHAMQGVASSTAGVVYYDGSSSFGSVGTDTISTSYPMCLGSDSYGDGYFTGAITEAGLWPTAFSTSTTNSINSNQHSYWGF